MYDPKQTLIQTFIGYLQETYGSVFSRTQLHHVDFLGAAGTKALSTIAQSDALYHNLEHTLLVTSVGQEILQAKQICEGHQSVTSEDWLHLITALLCHDIGYCKGVCQQDDCELGRHTTGVGEEYVFLPFGATDASLSSYHVDRSKRFVAEQFRDEPLIDVSKVQQIIDLTRFPAIQSSKPAMQLAILGRAADLVGQFSDRNYLQKLPALFYEFEQNGTNETLGYHHLTDVHSGLSKFYWNCVHSYVKDAIAYLKHTPTGQQIVTDLYANVSAPTAVCA
ncbi:MAG: metal-dependent phosphohydrolase [Leptolyngbya sp. SIO3F4]|nr:metal-dependent phosphohydrolase [Leptolyngbya sp. SIO3F4]